MRKYLKEFIFSIIVEMTTAYLLFVKSFNITSPETTKTIIFVLVNIVLALALIIWHLIDEKKHLTAEKKKRDSDMNFLSNKMVELYGELLAKMNEERTHTSKKMDELKEWVKKFR